jgi:hypothetical protein
MTDLVSLAVLVVAFAGLFGLIAVCDLVRR